MRLRQRVLEGHPLDPVRKLAAREQPEVWATTNIPRNLNSYEALHKPVNDAKQRLEIEKNYVSVTSLNVELEAVTCMYSTCTCYCADFAAD